MDSLAPAINKQGVQATIHHDKLSSTHDQKAIRDSLDKFCPETFGTIATLAPDTAKDISPLDDSYHSHFDHEYDTLARLTNKEDQQTLTVISVTYSNAPKSFRSY